MGVLAAGSVVGKKFRLVRRLARGGMGEVWVARHRDLDVDVALKLMRGRSDGAEGRSARRFEREAKAIARLKSPHLVRIYDTGLHKKVPFIAMELLDGEDLRARLARVGSLSLAEAAAIVRELADALDVAHAEGLVHRDLKPSNVFLTRERGREVVKLLDFGIAKDLRGAFATEETATGALLGSPRYMSPEQARGADVGTRSDVWALGVLTYELLTGAPLFDGVVLGDVFGKILSDEIPRATDAAPGLPADVNDVLSLALARDPNQRCASATAFSEALDEVAARYPDLPPVVDRAPARAADAVVEGPGRTAGTLGATEPTGTLGDSLAALDQSEGTRATRRIEARYAVPIGAAVAGLIGVAVWGWSGGADEVPAKDPTTVAATEVRPAPDPAEPVVSSSVPPPPRRQPSVASARASVGSSSAPPVLAPPAKVVVPPPAPVVLVPPVDSEREPEAEAEAEIQLDDEFGVPINPSDSDALYD